jgi:GT2 family glycosyltransferase
MTGAEKAGAATPGPARLGVVIVNYKRAEDTIECLESVLRSSVPLRVVVIDNASNDGSAERIMGWAAGTVSPTVASDAMAARSQPPIPKPEPLLRLSVGAIGTDPSNGRLTLIESPDNLGFAGGNNLGLKHLLADEALTCFWLLNNDTVIAPDTAEALLAEMESTPRIGMCGTTVCYYWRPGVIQALNGLRYDRLRGTAAAIGGGQPVDMPHDKHAVAAATDFVLGASLCVSRPFLKTVGMMEESYFLYFEELDWATRNERLGADRFTTAFADRAMVWHKEGGSIGSSSVKGQRSAFSDYWLTRSRLGYVRRFSPLLLPWHWLLTIGLAGRRLLRRQPDKARTVMRALLGLQY